MRYPLIKNVNKEEAVELMERADKILIVCIGEYYKSGWGYVPKFKILLDIDNDLIELRVEDSGYYSKRTKTYNLSVWGTDRRFELLYRISNNIDKTDELLEKTYFIG